MKLPLHRRLQAALALAAFLVQSLAPFAPAQQSSGVPQLLNYQGRVTVGGVNHQGTGWFKFSLVDGGTNQNRTATARVSVNGAGEINGVEVTDGGSGYVTPPAVTIEGTGTGAEVDAFLENGQVSEFDVRDGGSGYSTVTETIAHLTAPPANIVPTTFWSNDGTAANGMEPQTAVARSVTKGLYSVLLGDTDMQPLPAQVFANPDVRLRVWFSAAEEGPFTLLTPDQRIAAVGYALMAEDVKDGAITSAKLAADAVTMAQLSPELRQSIQSIQAWQATQLPVITSAAAADAAVEYPFTYQITASGLPLSYGATGLPAGLSVNTSTGLITGIPGTAGTVTFNVTATNVAGLSPPKAVTVTILGAVYVDFTTGLDGNAGTQAAPVKTVAQGVAVAQAGAVRRAVLVSGAAQTLAAPLVLPNGARLKGGYDRAAGWTRTAPRTPLNRFGGTAPAADATVPVILASGLTEPVLVDGFNLNATLAPVSPGSSSTGIFVKDCTQMVTISNNTISPGNGGPGTSGAAGNAGAAGGDGGDGGPVQVNYSATGTNDTYAGGGTRGDGFYHGGTGGFGACLYARPIAGFGSTQAANGGPGLSGLGDPAGAGSGGGAGGDNGYPTATNGWPGTAGIAGAAGAHGTAPSASLVFMPAGIVAVPGWDGIPGAYGHGGGGGGGGGRITSGTFGEQSVPSRWGGCGGGGGAGGGGGQGGKAGLGGGGSFGVIVTGSSVTVSNCQITTLTGGPGGAGGNGGAGGAGGSGGNGHVTAITGGKDPGNGGTGGTGGTGGAGGGGSGGSGGASVGILARNGSTITESGNTFTLGNAGAGGQGGLRGGSTTNRAPTGLNGVRQNVLTGVTP